MGGRRALPFALGKVIILEQVSDAIRARVLSLFAGEAQRLIGIRGEICIRVTDNRELQRLNLRFRRKNKPTDVLSFPSNSNKIAGDIAISAEIAAANAAELGHSIETELKILIVHGLLHLAGFDHKSDKGEMRSRETLLRRKFGLPLGLIERAQGKQAIPAGSPLGPGHHRARRNSSRSLLKGRGRRS